MKLIPTSSQISAERVSRICVLAGRLILLFSTLLILVMPWTEYACNFDRFPYEGQDFELGILAIAAIFGLAIILLRHGQQEMSLMLALRSWLAFICRDTRSCLVEGFCAPVATFHIPPLPSPALEKYNLPLLV